MFLNLFKRSQKNVVNTGPPSPGTFVPVESSTSSDYGSEYSSDHDEADGVAVLDYGDLTDLQPSRRQASQANLNRFLAGQKPGLQAYMQGIQVQAPPGPAPDTMPPGDAFARRDRRRSVGAVPDAYPPGQSQQHGLAASQAALIMMPHRMRAELEAANLPLSAAAAARAGGGSGAIGQPAAGGGTALPQLGSSAAKPPGMPLSPPLKAHSNSRASLTGGHNTSRDSSPEGGRGLSGRQATLVRHGMHQAAGGTESAKDAQQRAKLSGNKSGHLLHDPALMAMASALAGQGGFRASTQRRNSVTGQLPVSANSMHRGVDASASAVTAAAAAVTAAAAALTRPAGSRSSNRRSEPGEGPMAPRNERRQSMRHLDALITNAQTLNQYLCRSPEPPPTSGGGGGGRRMNRTASTSGPGCAPGQQLLQQSAPAGIPGMHDVGAGGPGVLPSLYDVAAPVTAGGCLDGGDAYGYNPSDYVSHQVPADVAAGGHGARLPCIARRGSNGVGAMAAAGNGGSQQGRSGGANSGAAVPAAAVAAAAKAVAGHRGSAGSVGAGAGAGGACRSNDTGGSALEVSFTLRPEAREHARDGGGAGGAGAGAGGAGGSSSAVGAAAAAMAQYEMEAERLRASALRSVDVRLGRSVLDKQQQQHLTVVLSTGASRRSASPSLSLSPAGNTPPMISPKSSTVGGLSRLELPPAAGASPPPGSEGELTPVSKARAALRQAAAEAEAEDGAPPHVMPRRRAPSLMERGDHPGAAVQPPGDGPRGPAPAGASRSGGRPLLPSPVRAGTKK